MLPNGAVMWDTDTGSSTSLKWRFSSHHLRGIRTCGGSGERLKPLACLSQGHHVPRGILVVLNVWGKMGQERRTNLAGFKTGQIKR